MALRMPRTSASKKRDIKNIPLDRERALTNRIVFGKSLVGISPIEDSGFINYTVNQGDNTIQYQFDKTKLTGLLDQLKRKFDGKVSLGDLGLSMFYAMFLFNAQDGTGLEGECTLSQIRRQLDIQKGGKQNAQIKKVAYSLASLSVVRMKGKSEDNRDIEYYPYFNYFKIKIRGEETIFAYKFNEDALGANAPWLKSNDLDRSVFTKGYLTMPVAELKVSKADRKYDAFRERIRNLKADPLNKVRLSTILEDWLFFSRDMLRRKSACLEKVNGFFLRAKGEGELREVKIIKDSEQKSWRDQILYVIFK